MEQADFGSIRDSLFTGTGDLSWLTASWQEPLRFWSGLISHWQDVLPLRVRSAPFREYGFYPDLVLRHKDNPAPVLKWHDGSRWRSLAYSELAQRVEGLFRAWIRAGATAGQGLALLHPFGPEWLAALLAGLRIGLVVSPLPIAGTTLLAHRLEALCPDWIVLDRLGSTRLPADLKDKILPDGSPAAPTLAGHFYRSTDTAAACLDPSSTAKGTPAPVSADALFLGALRDALLVLGLAPGTACAAPGWHFLESQPALALAVLMAGATFIDLDLTRLEGNPDLLVEQPVDVLLASRGLRDLLLRCPLGHKHAIRAWLRQPAESPEPGLWQEFADANGLAGVKVGNAAWSASAGGCILFSRRHPSRVHQEILPMPGQPWHLASLLSHGHPAPARSGWLAVAPLGTEEPVWLETPHILARSGVDTWLHIGVHPPGRAGRRYPREELEAVLGSLGACHVAIEIPAAFGHGEWRQIVLAFGEPEDEGRRRDTIERELGAEFLPDGIENLRLLPRFDDEGQPDRAWCQSNYVIGELYRREKDPVYRCLSRLKGQILAS